MIVDDKWVWGGSTNMANRSFRVNDEVNLNIIDSRWAVNMVIIFKQDKEHSKKITYEEWVQRPLLSKILEKFSYILSPQV